MKFTQLAACVTVAAAGISVAQAESYYGLGYTQNFKNDRVEAVMRSHLVSETLESTIPITGVDFQNNKNYGVTGVFGIPVKGNFAIEARYTYFNDFIDSSYRIDGINSSYDEELGEAFVDEIGNETIVRGDAHKFGLHGVYRHSLNSFLYAKGAVGATYTTADLKHTRNTYTNGTLTETEQNNLKYATGMGQKFKNNQFDVEATVGIGIRLTSCCNLELDYNSSKYQESATAQVVWHW